MGATSFGCAHEQGVEREVRAPETEADDDDAGQQLVEVVGQRGASGTERQRGQRACQHRVAGVALQSGPRQRHAAERSDEVDAHDCASRRQRNAEVVRESDKQRPVE